MVTTLELKIAETRVNGTKQVVEGWQRDHIEAQRASDLEKLAQTSVELIGPLRGIYDNLRNGIRSTKQVDEIVRVHQYGVVLHVALQIFNVVRTECLKTKDMGYAIAGFEELTAAEEEVKRQFEEIKQKWLLPDQATVRASEQDFRDGKYSPL